MTATMTRGSLSCLPRFGTPRSDRPTLGDKAGVIAARLRRPLMPWQQHVADVALELDPDGSLHYDEVNLLVGRQEGKTELKFVLMVMRMSVMAARLGPQRVTYTMQNRKKARTRLERDYAPRLRRAAGFKEIPAVSRLRPVKQTEWRLGMNSGVEAIQFGPESYIQIDTPNRTDGHGDSIDAGFIDEAFAHEDNTVELGMEPAMVTRGSAQLWVLSASGDEKSKYLWGKVLRGRKLADADSTVAYFEWSAEYGEDDPADPETWQRACPALGRTITEAKLRSLYSKALEDGRKESMDGFCRSYLCMWPEVPVLGEGEGFQVITNADWQACLDEKSGPLDPVSFALDVAEDRSWSAIAVGGKSGRGGAHVEVTFDQSEGCYDYRPGTDWVVARAKKIHEKWGRPFAIVKGSPAWSLEADLTAAGVELAPITPQEFAQACGQFYDAAVQHQLKHLGQPCLTAAVANVAKRKTSGDAFVWDRRNSTVDISPLVAATEAWFLAQQAGPLASGLVDPNDYDD